MAGFRERWGMESPPAGGRSQVVFHRAQCWAQSGLIPLSTTWTRESRAAAVAFQRTTGFLAVEDELYVSHPSVQGEAEGGSLSFYPGEAEVQRALGGVGAPLKQHWETNLQPADTYMAISPWQLAHPFPESQKQMYLPHPFPGLLASFGWALPFQIHYSQSVESFRLHKQDALLSESLAPPTLGVE